MFHYLRLLPQMILFGKKNYLDDSVLISVKVRQQKSGDGLSMLTVLHSASTNWPICYYSEAFCVLLVKRRNLLSCGLSCQLCMLHLYAEHLHNMRSTQAAFVSVCVYKNSLWASTLCTA